MIINSRALVATAAQLAQAQATLRIGGLYELSGTSTSTSTSTPVKNGVAKALHGLPVSAAKDPS